MRYIRVLIFLFSIKNLQALNITLFDVYLVRKYYTNMLAHLNEFSYQINFGENSHLFLLSPLKFH